MAAGPKPTRSAKKKRRRTLREEIVDYVVEIDGWDWVYSFSLNSERHLVKGRLLTPAGLKTDRAEISLLPSTDLEEDRRKDLKPIALGSLSVTEDAILGDIGIPWDALTPVLQMLIAGRFKFVLMRGIRFRRRMARLNGLRLDTRLTEDDMALAGPCKSPSTIHLTSVSHPKGW